MKTPPQGTQQIPASRKTAVTLRRQRSYARAGASCLRGVPESCSSLYKCSKIFNSAISELVGISTGRGNSLLCASASFSSARVTFSQSRTTRSSMRKCSPRIRSPQNESSISTSKSSASPGAWQIWTIGYSRRFTRKSIVISWLFEGHVWTIRRYVVEGEVYDYPLHEQRQIPIMDPELLARLRKLGKDREWVFQSRN